MLDLKTRPLAAMAVRCYNGHALSKRAIDSKLAVDIRTNDASTNCRRARLLCVRATRYFCFRWFVIVARDPVPAGGVWTEELSWDTLDAAAGDDGEAAQEYMEVIVLVA